MNKWKIVVSFASGIILGGGLTYLTTKGRMERQKIQEINEYRKTIVNANRKIQAAKKDIQESEEILKNSEEKAIKNSDPSTDISKTKSKPDTSKDVFTAKTIDEYKNYAEQYDPANNTEAQKAMADLKKAEHKPVSGPYAIDPDDYGSILEYDQVHLTYYKDGYLVDDDNNIVGAYTLKDSIGEDFKDYFGLYSDDAAWFRNDDKKCEYEVERSMDTYY